MSKQSQASTIVRAGVTAGLDRQTMIDEICAQTGAGPGYAATLYAAGRRSITAVTSTTKPTSGGKMSTFTNANMDLLRSDIDAALNVINEKYGVTIDMGSIRYAADRLSFNSKLSFGVGGEDTIAQNTWNSYCHRYGLKPEHFGKEFESNGETFTLSGVKPRGKKYNILAKNPAGKCYKFNAEMIARKMK